MDATSGVAVGGPDRHPVGDTAVAQTQVPCGRSMLVLLIEVADVDDVAIRVHKHLEELVVLCG